MSFDGVPKIFWYALSLCLIMATFAIGYVSYIANDVSIKYKDLEYKSTKLEHQESLVSLEKSNFIVQDSLFNLKEKELADLKLLIEKREEELKNLQSNILSYQRRPSNAPSELIEEISKVVLATPMAKIEEKQTKINGLESQQLIQQRQFQSMQQKQIFRTVKPKSKK